jgi:hypothetical protein
MMLLPASPCVETSLRDLESGGNCGYVFSDFVTQPSTMFVLVLLELLVGFGRIILEKGSHSNRESHRHSLDF